MKFKQPDIKGLDSPKFNKKNFKVTPMISQYLEVKERHKEYLLFYRMGDFYELFFEDAKIAANELGIALTKRGKFGEDDIPMCGVPAHSSHTYISRLINSGFKVAIAEQIGGLEVNSKKNYQKILQEKFPSKKKSVAISKSLLIINLIFLFLQIVLNEL